MDDATSTPESIAAALAEAPKGRVQSLPVEPDGAQRAAILIGQLLE